MVITRHGNGAFRVQSGDTAIVVDPEDNRLKADTTLQTGTLLPLSPFMGEPTEILGPGEYDIKGVKITGHRAIEPTAGAKSVNTVYEVKTEDLTLAFLGNPSGKPDIGLVEKLGDIDILFAAPGTGELAHQLEPKITVVTHVKDPKAAAKEFGAKIETIDKLSVRKKDLPEHPKTVFIHE